MAKNYNAVIHNPTGRKDCILIVCPPSHDQQGAKMAATMRALKGYNIRGIWLADALDQHNSGSLDAAVSKGDQWLERHKPMLGNIPVTRWQQVRWADGFREKYLEIIRLYGQDDTSRQAVDNICRRHAKTIVSRFAARGVKPDPESIMIRCVNYMLEEIAGLSVIRDQTDSPEAYPGEYFADSDIFHRRSRVSLRLPGVLPVSFLISKDFVEVGALA